MVEETISELEDTSIESSKTEKQEQRLGEKQTNKQKKKKQGKKQKTTAKKQNSQELWDGCVIPTIWHFWKGKALEIIKRSVVAGVGEGYWGEVWRDK